MTIFQRVLLSVMCMMIVTVSLPYVMFREAYFFIEPVSIYVIIIAGISVAVYNLTVVYFEAEKRYYILGNDEFKERLNENKGSEE